MSLVIIVTISLSVLTKIANSAKILGVFYMPYYSHHIVHEPFIRELYRKNHAVTLITSNPLNDPLLENLREIDVSYFYRYRCSLVEGFDTHFSYKRIITTTLDAFAKLVEEIFKNEEFRDILTEKFDVIIIEDFNPLLYVLGAHFKSPVISFNSFEAPIFTQRIYGNPIHPVLYGDPLISTFMHLTILDKIRNSYYMVWDTWHYNYVILPKYDKIAKKYFGEYISTIQEASNNVSIMFMNTNYYVTKMRPMAASIVQLGFMHIKMSKPLPQDLQKIMEKATNGVVYVSLGTNVKSSTLNPELINVFVQAFSKLPYTILWKWETEEIPTIKDNIVFKKWFPQQDILAHPNVKVFVTQGGLQSIEEAISMVVPMVGIPFIADQNMNVHRLQQAGVAKYIDWRTATQNILREAIETVATNIEYKTNLQKIKDVLMDEPMTGLEKAVWWTEYVIRHNGAKHLRSILADTPLWEYLMLDVLAVVLSFLIVTFYIIYKLTAWLTRKIKALIFKEKIKQM